MYNTIMDNTMRLSSHTNQGLESILSEAQSILQKNSGLMRGMLSYQKNDETGKYVAREWFENE